VDPQLAAFNMRAADKRIHTNWEVIMIATNTCRLRLARNAVNALAVSTQTVSGYFADHEHGPLRAGRWESDRPIDRSGSA